KIIKAHGDLLAARSGAHLTVTAISSRDPSKDRGVALDGLKWYDDARDLADDPNVDIVLELIGGSDGVARELCEKSLRSGKPVVTANKAMLAEYGNELARLAEENNTPLAY